MTENLLERLEEKVMFLLSELEELRQEKQRLNQDISMLKNKEESYARKLQDLISVLETMNVVPLAATGNAEPVLVQG